MVFVPKAAPLDMPVYLKARGPPRGCLGGSGPVTGRTQARGPLAAPDTAGAGLSSNPDSLSSNPGALSSNLAGLTSNLTALDCNLPSRDDLLHGPWSQTLLNELPGGLAARLGAIGRRHPPQG